jgi:hypothetical protein
MNNFKDIVPSSNSNINELLDLFDNNSHHFLSKNNSDDCRTSKNQQKPIMILKNVPPPNNNKYNGKSYKARSSPREARVKESPIKKKKEREVKKVNKFLESDSSIISSLYNTIKSSSLSKNNRTKDNNSSFIPQHIKTTIIIEKIVNYHKKIFLDTINELDVREYIFSNKENDNLDFSKEIFLISKGNATWIQVDDDNDKYKINFQIKSIYEMSISLDFIVPSTEQTWVISHHISDVSLLIIFILLNLLLLLLWYFYFLD